MKNAVTVRILGSLFLILMGVALLLDNLNLLPFTLSLGQWFIAGLFAFIGLAFFYVFVSAPQQNWWAAIPSFTLFGLGVMISGIFDRPGQDMNGAGAVIFFGMISLSFWVIAFVKRENWWAVIPGGVLLSLAGVVAVSESPMIGEDSLLTPAILFLGIGITFFAVYLRGIDGSRPAWALWPAAILTIIAIMMGAGAVNQISYGIGILMILIGIWILVQSLRANRRQV